MRKSLTKFIIIFVNIATFLAHAGELNNTVDNGSGKALVIIDMQKNFIEKFYDKYDIQAVISNIHDKIKENINENSHIIFVTYENEGPIHDELLTAVKDYDKVLIAVKNCNDGGLAVRWLCVVNKIFLTKMDVCGINTNACVNDTVESLSELFENAEIYITSAACGDCYGSGEDTLNQLNLISNVTVIKSSSNRNIFLLPHDKESVDSLYYRLSTTTRKFLGRGESYLIIDPRNKVNSFIVSGASTKRMNHKDAEKYCHDALGALPTEEQFQALVRASSPDGYYPRGADVSFWLASIIPNNRMQQLFYAENGSFAEGYHTRNIHVLCAWAPMEEEVISILIDTAQFAPNSNARTAAAYAIGNLNRKGFEAIAKMTDKLNLVIGRGGKLISITMDEMGYLYRSMTFNEKTTIQFNKSDVSKVLSNLPKADGLHLIERTYYCGINLCKRFKFPNGDEVTVYEKDARDFKNLFAD